MNFLDENTLSHIVGYLGQVECVNFAVATQNEVALARTDRMLDLVSHDEQERQTMVHAIVGDIPAMEKMNISDTFRTAALWFMRMVHSDSIRGKSMIRYDCHSTLLNMLMAVGKADFLLESWSSLGKFVNLKGATLMIIDAIQRSGDPKRVARVYIEELSLNQDVRDIFIQLSRGHENVAKARMNRIDPRKLLFNDEISMFGFLILTKRLGLKRDSIGLGHEHLELLENITGERVLLDDERMETFGRVFQRVRV